MRVLLCKSHIADRDPRRRHHADADVIYIEIQLVATRVNTRFYDRS